MKNKAIFVTGGTGSFGHQFVEFFLDFFTHKALREVWQGLGLVSVRPVKQSK